MPIKMGTEVRSVVIKDCVYIGGGSAGNDRDKCTVMKLDLQQNKWTKLPQYIVMYFAMTSLANQLVLVGGYDPVRRKPANQIALFTMGRWTTPYPPMHTPRSFSTAVCFNNHVIVVGGLNDQESTTSVELLDVEARRWHTAKILPNPRNELKSTVIGNTLYLMGGYDHTGYTKVVHKVDLNELVTKAVSKEAKPTLWQAISDTPLKHSSPLSVGGSLLAVGGYDDCVNPSSSIHLYQPKNRKWVKVGDLPTAHCSCACSVLPSGEVIVAGGWDRGYAYTNAIYFLRINHL